MYNWFSIQDYYKETLFFVSLIKTTFSTIKPLFTHKKPFYISKKLETLAQLNYFYLFRQVLQSEWSSTQLYIGILVVLIIK